MTEAWPTEAWPTEPDPAAIVRAPTLALPSEVWKRVTEAEKWRTLARVLAVTVPPGTVIGFGLGWLVGGAGASMAAGAATAGGTTT